MLQVFHGILNHPEISKDFFLDALLKSNFNGLPAELAEGSPLALIAMSC